MDTVLAHRPGVRPDVLVNWRVMWLWSAKPASAAAATSGRPLSIAIAAVFASGRLANGAAGDAAAKLAVLAVMILLINTTWLIAGASLAPLLRDPRRARVVNAGLAVALVAATALAVIR